jgi:hypothetical protein
MGIKMVKCESEAEAMKKIGEIVTEAKARDWDVFLDPIGGHVNPGDAFDAYEETGLKPTEEDILTSEYASPLGAFVMWQQHPGDESAWRKLVNETFDPRYMAGYFAGFSLNLPVDMDEYFRNTHYIRGVYDGVMSRAAVF